MALLSYDANELRSLNRQGQDVKLPRSVRKAIFGLRLWKPVHERQLRQPLRYGTLPTCSNQDPEGGLGGWGADTATCKTTNTPDLDRPSKPKAGKNTAFNMMKFQKGQEKRAQNKKAPGRLLRVATLNVATLRNKVEELTELMKERKLDILGLCETRMKGNGRSTVHGDFVLLHSGTDTTRHRVALLVTPEIGNRITDVRYINERMMGMSVKIGNSYIDLVQVYAPQQGRPLSEKEE